MVPRASATGHAELRQRNRYVDFLRAVSILMVVTGHWLIVALWLDRQRRRDVLVLRPFGPTAATCIFRGWPSSSHCPDGHPGLPRAQTVNKRRLRRLARRAAQPADFAAARAPAPALSVRRPRRDPALLGRLGRRSAKHRVTLRILIPIWFCAPAPRSSCSPATYRAWLAGDSPRSGPSRSAAR